MDPIRDEEFRAVEDEAVAFAPRRRADALHVGACFGLRDGDGGDDGTGHDARHPAVTLRSRSGVPDMDRRHVGVNEGRDCCSAIGRAAEFLREDHGREHIHVGSAIFLRISSAEEAELTHPPQHLARNAALLLPAFAVRLDLLLHETPDLHAEQFMFRSEPG
jgi:hypothetical protein